MNARWKQRPPGSNWGDFGPDDENGRLNLITPAKVLEGLAEVKEGRTFCLSLPLDYPGGNSLNPRRYPPRLFATRRGDDPNYNYRLSNEDAQLTDVVSDDAVLLHCQYSTQWDSFAHFGGMWDAEGNGVPEPMYYNGWRAVTDVKGPSDRETFEGVHANRLGIEKMAERCVQGRAVLIDLHAHFGDARRHVGHDDLMRVCEADRVVVESGDMVCIHTGFTRLLLSMNRMPDATRMHSSCAVLDGSDERLRQWISDSGVSALIADNFAVEVFPPPGVQDAHDHAHTSMPLHEHCLFKLGIHLGEYFYLADLAAYLRANKRSRFLLTAPPLRLPGAVGSPATPVATV